MADLNEIIERSKDGDQAAFGLLVDRFQDMAVAYAYAVLGDFQLAEDAAQEAFLDVQRTIEQLREPKAFSGWLRRIVFKQCDRITRTLKQTLVPLDSVLEQAAKTPDPYEVVVMGETNHIIQQALAQLPEQTRDVVIMHYMSEYTQGEIAAYLDVSVRTVKRRLSQGRALLQEKFLTELGDELRRHRPSRNQQLKEQVMQSIAGDKDRHSEPMYRIMESDPNGTIQREWRAGRVEHSHTDWAVSRIGTAAGQLIAAYGIFDISMRIGAATVRVGGNNWNTIHPEYEDQADEIFRRLAADSFAAMRAQGYDMAANFESADWAGQRHSFGWHEYVWTVATADLPAQEPGLQLSQCPSDYRKDLGDLYNRYASGLTGTAVRPTFLRNKHPDNFTTWYWTDGQGAPSGYISGNQGAWLTLDLALAADLGRLQLSGRLRTAIEDNGFGPVSDQTLCIPVDDNQWWIIDPAGDGDWRVERGGKARMVVWVNGDGVHLRPRLEPEFRVDEAAGEPGQVLQVLGKLARESGHGKVVFDRLHYQSPLARHLRAMGTARISLQTPNYYLRILNLQAVFEKLAPELSRRLDSSLLADWRGDLLIGDGEEEIMLAIDRTKVEVVAAGQTKHAITGGAEMVQLIVGTDTPEEVVATNDIALQGDAQHLVGVLFPIQYPQMENQAM
ncbi:MAG: sigma-70 family RNA polymerase sigma factor [Candidatus Latescibacteria bacterium]|nr:sigma-70 family RNA polymerase sigma factor [Candidatus Latescibacterota bacterium]